MVWTFTSTTGSVACNYDNLLSCSCRDAAIKLSMLRRVLDHVVAVESPMYVLFSLIYKENSVVYHVVLMVGEE